MDICFLAHSFVIQGPIVVAILLALIPVVLQIAGFAIQWFGASKADLDAYQKMIEANKDAGLITVDTYTKLTDFHQQMRDDYEKRNTPNPSA